MNDLARMLKRMEQADAEPNPVKAMRILLGWTCGTCLKEFDPGPDGPMLGVRLTLGLPILCILCSDCGAAPGQP